MTALLFEDVRANYGPYKALNGLSLSVQPGEAVAVLGRNGAGKSTLFRVASGLVPVSSGHALILGQPIGKRAPHLVAKQGVVHLPEGVGLFSGLTIEENLTLRIGGNSRLERRERMESAVSQLGSLRDRLRSKAGELSGGQQRLVAVAAALAAKPRLLLADEPALGLSPAAADDVYGALAQIRSTSAALIIIETRLGRVSSLCPRALVMNTGVAVFDGGIDDARAVMAQLLQPSMSP